MADINQCSVCGRQLSNCPYYNTQDKNVCKNYVKPIDNSKFFGRFYTFTGRIGRIEYIVSMIIATAIYILLLYQNNPVLEWIGFAIYSAITFLAGIKRCHDASNSWWWTLILFLGGLPIPFIGFFAIIAFIYLFIMKGDEEPNAHGTVPGKPYEEQIKWYPSTDE